MKKTKLFSLLMLMAIFSIGQMWAVDYELMLTMDLSAASTTAGTSDGITTDANLLTFLRNSVSTATNIKSATVGSGNIYAGKGSGGAGIPNAVLKIGKASGAGALSFTIADALDDVAKVEITGYGWKTSTAVSINGSEAQNPEAAASEVTFPYTLATATKSISISVTTSAFCATEIKLYKAVASAVEDPTFTPTDGDFTNSVSVSLACTTDGADIYYTTNGDDPTSASTKFTAAFNLTATTTVKAIAIKGSDASHITSKTYTKIGMFSCADIYGLENSAKAKLNDVTVTYVSGQNVYVKDASGAIVLYLPAANSWVAGDVLSKIQGTVNVYNGLHQVRLTADQVSAVEVTSGDAPAAEELTAAPTSADLNKYVAFNNVTVATVEFTTASANQYTTLTVGSDEVQLRNGFKKALTFADGTHYNVVGIVNYNENVEGNEIHVYAISGDEKPCASKITITKADNPDHGTFTLNNSGEVCIEYGKASTTVTATPDTHYHLATVTSTDGTVGDIDGNTCTITDIDANTTISVTFAENDKYEVTWNVDGEKYTSTNVYTGEKPVFPAEDPTAPESFGTSNTFYGWAAATWTGKAANLEDKTVYTEATASDMPAVTAAIAYHAVFAKEDADEAWQKVTDFAVGDVVVFVSEAGSKELTGVGIPSGTTSIGIATAYEDDIAATFPLTVEAGSAADSYSFKNGNNYLSWSAENSLTTSTTKNSASSWTISASTNGNYKFANVGTSGRKLQYNTGSPRWACYTTNQAAFQIYKQEATVVYSDYMTTYSETPTAVDNVESSAKAVKVLKNGLLLIEKNGKTYNAQGQLVK